MQVCSFLGVFFVFFAARRGFRFGPAFAEGRGRGVGTVRSEFTPPPKGQLSTSGREGKQRRIKPEWFERTSQGRFQLAQHVVMAVSHRGYKKEVRGSSELMEGGKEGSNYKPRLGELNMEAVV